MGARRVLPSLTTERVSIRRESAVDVTEAKDDLRSGPPVPGSDRSADEMADVVCEAAAVDPVLISREARRLVVGAPSPSLSLVAKPRAIEFASSIEPLRNGLEMLDLETGLRNEGFLIEKLLGGAAPRTEERGFAGTPGRVTAEFVVGVGTVPVWVEPEKLEAKDSCDSL